MVMKWLLVLIYISVATAQTATNCEVRPQISKVIECCKFPAPKWDSYGIECSKYNNDINKLINPCIIDCVFNESKVLENDVLNMENARTMISKLYEGNPEFIQTYNIGFEKCQELMKQTPDKVNKGDRGLHSKMRGPSNCRSLPMMYAMCSHRDAFINCPTSAWTGSTECENAKNFALNCGHGSLSGKKRSKFSKSFTATGLEPVGPNGQIFD